MGYTHYWNTKTATSDTWNKFTELAKLIVDKFDGDIMNGDGTGTPVIDDKIICLNGNNATDDDFETFFIEHGTEKWNFCKTALKPYDAVVVAILIVGEKLKVLTWTSDGSDDCHDFDEGRALLEAINFKY